MVGLLLGIPLPLLGSSDVVLNLCRDFEGQGKSRYYPEYQTRKGIDERGKLAQCSERIWLARTTKHGVRGLISWKACTSHS